MHEVADHVDLEVHVAADAIVECHVPRRRARENAARPLRPRCAVGTPRRRTGCGSGRRTSAADPTASARCRSASSCSGVQKQSYARPAARSSLRVLLIEDGTLRLTVRAVGAADVGSLVPRQAKPAEVVENRALGFDGRSLAIGVLDAKDERAALPACEQPVVERRPRVADVQVTGRTGSETQTRSGLQEHPCRNSATAWTAMPSPRPISPMPSLVLPLTLTASNGHLEGAGEPWRGCDRCAAPASAARR